MKALKLDEKKLEIILVQFANLKKIMKFTYVHQKREFFKLTELVKEVGADATDILLVKEVRSTHGFRY